MEVPVLDRVCVNIAPLPGEYPVTVGPLAEQVQGVRLPAALAEMLMLVAVPEQRVWAAGVKVTVVTGRTAAFTTMSVPLQPARTGVMEYVTVSVAFPELYSFCRITIPELLEKPVRNGLDGTAIQENEALGGTDVRNILTESALHVTDEGGTAVAAGIGLTVAVMSVRDWLVHPDSVTVDPT